MARIYQPRKRQSDGRWDMTVGSDDEGWVHPEGYCAGWFEWTEEKAGRVGMSLESCLKDQEALLPHKHKFHTDGHATSDEASACWDAFVLDTELEFRDLTDEQRKCAVCGVFTGHVADLGRQFSRRFFLCPEHATREHVVTLRDEERARRRANR